MKRLSICLYPAAAAFLAAAITCGTASGEFIKIDDFEGYSIGPLDGQGVGSSSWAADDGIEVATEPGTGNKALVALAGAFDATAANASPLLEIADGSTGTLFVRFRRGAGNHAIFGMSDLEDPLEWIDFETAIGNRYETGRNPGVIDVRNAGAYQNVADVAEDEWVNVWMVIDNENDSTQVYAQSDTTFPNQTQWEYQGQTDFVFRNGTEDPLVSFFLRIGANSHDDDFYLDDIYMDQAGGNLADPRGGAAPLQAGDADMDLDFDQLDLVRVQIAAKYLTGLPANWSEGDWNGAPGGQPGNPPPGNGVFDQLDIIAALAPGHYLTGPYAAGLGAGQEARASVPSDALAVGVPVPEPSGWLLLAVGCLALRLCGIRRRVIHPLDCRSGCAARAWRCGHAVAR